MKIQLFQGTILAALFCLLMMTACGCIGADYVANRDIIVIRLDPNGTSSWTRIIDTGYDDSVLDLAETLDGGLVIAGGKTSQRIGPPSPRLIRLSPDGTVLWDRVLGEDSGELTSVLPIADGGYAAVSLDGRIWRLEPAGNVQWILSTGLEQVWSVIATTDTGFMVAGESTGHIPYGTVVIYHSDGTVSSRPPFVNESVMTPGCTETSLSVGPDRTMMVTQCTVPYKIISQGTVIKLDGEGNISWKRSYGGEGLHSAWSVLEDSTGEGFLVAGFSPYPGEGGNLTSFLSTVQIDTEGNPIRVSRIDQIEYYQPPLLRSGPEGYNLLYINTTLKDGFFYHNPAVVRIGPEGLVSTPQVIDAGVIITWTGDGGYFFAGFPPVDRYQGYSEVIFGRAHPYSLHATRLDPDGNRMWDREIQGVVVNYVKKVIQTSDGGYVILAMREN